MRYFIQKTFGPISPIGLDNMKNLNRHTAYFSRMAAISDYKFVCGQTGDACIPDLVLYGWSAKKIDKLTRGLINAAILSGVALDLPDGWNAAEKP